MAKVEKRENKKGTVYRIRVFDKRLQGGETSMTYKPEERLTAKQLEKELTKQAVLFEDAVIKRLEQEEKERLEQQENPKPKPKPKKKFKDIANEWLEYEETQNRIKISTLERYKQLTERTYKAIGDIWIDELTRKDIQHFIKGLAKKGVNQRTGQGLSPKTQKHYVNFISDVLNYAIDEEIIEENKCNRIKISKASETEQAEKEDLVFYSKSEMRLILNKVKSENNTMYYVFFLLLAFGGLRRAEALGLEWKDIDYSSGEVIINIRRTSNYRNSNTGVYKSTPKTQKSKRVINLGKYSEKGNNEIIEHLKLLRREQRHKKAKCGDLWNENDRIFITWNGEPMNPNTPYTFLERLCERENMQFKGLHAFRHGYATDLITSGVPINIVSALLGHSTITTTYNIYTHPIQEYNAKILNTFETALDIL